FLFRSVKICKLERRQCLREIFANGDVGPGRQRRQSRRPHEPFAIVRPDGTVLPGIRNWVLTLPYPESLPLRIPTRTGFSCSAGLLSHTMPVPVHPSEA